MGKGLIIKEQDKRAQITILVVIAVVIVTALVSVSYINYASKDGEGRAFVKKASFVSDATANLKEQRDDCLKKTFVQGLDLYGLDEEAVKNHVLLNAGSCISPMIDEYKKQFDVEAEMESVDVKINYEKIEMDAEFPISVQKEESRGSMGSYSLTFLRTSTKMLAHDSDCVLTSDAALLSFDGKFEIFIPEGAKATKESGDCLDSITLHLEDPVKSYGDRTASLDSITYEPGPVGARFDKTARLKLKYTSKDYNDYINSIIKSNYYAIPEKELKMDFYDKHTNNFYVYPSDAGLKNSADAKAKTITAEVEQFYGSKLAADSDCKMLSRTLIESFDRRVLLDIPAGVVAVKNESSCLDRIKIEIKPKSSRVVNFGYSDYEMLPDDAQFEPYIYYIYKYSKAEVQNPVFLYGWKNWQDLINGTWISPVQDSPPKIKLINPENNKRFEKGNIDFVFSATDDFDSNLTCGLYINGVKEGGEILVKNGSSKSISKEMPDEGYYYWFVECEDRNSNGASESRNLAVGNISYAGFTGFIARNLAGEIKNALTGFAISIKKDNEIKKRSEKELKIAYYDEADGVYRPLSTRIDIDKKTITAKITHFSILIPAQGCNDKGYAVFTSVNFIRVDGNGNCTGVSHPGEKKEYRIDGGNSCGDKDTFITLKEKISSGDSGTLIKDESTASGSHKFKVDPLIDADSSLSDKANVCAWADVYMGVVGIGVSTAALAKNISAEEFEKNTGVNLDERISGKGGEGEGGGEGGGGGGKGSAYETGGTYNRNTSNLIGYGPVNYWMNVDSAVLAQKLSENGLTATQVEFLGMGEIGYYDNPASLFAKFKTFAENMRASNITMFVNVVNWNKGKSGKDPSICEARYSDAWFQNILNFLKNEIGAEKIILQPASEWGGSCGDKAQRWHNMVVQQWNGSISWNKGARPKTSPSPDFYIEYHPFSTNENYPRGAIVTTDTSKILAELSKTGKREGFANPGKLEAYARNVHNSGSGFFYYGFGHQSIDFEAIEALGRVMGK